MSVCVHILEVFFKSARKDSHNASNSPVVCSHVSLTRYMFITDTPAARMRHIHGNCKIFLILQFIEEHQVFKVDTIMKYL